MPVDEALRRVQQELSDNPVVNVILASRYYGEEEDNLQRLNIGADLQQQFQEIARDAVVGEIRLG